jgi:hypothetical protein
MQKYSYCLLIPGILFFSSMAMPSHVQEPGSLPTFSQGRRYLTSEEVQGFVYRDQRPADLNVGRIFSMAWTDIERALNHALTDIRDNGYQNLNKINEVLGIEACYRRLRTKDRHTHIRLAQIERIENNIGRARAAITTTLDSRVRDSFFRLISSSNRENRQQEFNNIFYINSRFGRLSPALLPVAESYFHVVITSISSTPHDTFKENPLRVLPIEEDFSLRDFSRITDPTCLSAVRSLREKLLRQYHRNHSNHERSFLSDCRNHNQRTIAVTALEDSTNKIKKLYELMAIPVQEQDRTAENKSSFYKLLADSNLLTPSEIRTHGRSTDLACRVLASVNTFTSVLAEGIHADTATKPNLELAIEYSQALASVIKSDSFPQQTKVNALRSLAIEIDAGALEHIASDDRKILRRLDAIRLSWAQQVLNWTDQTEEVYKQAYSVLEAVILRKSVRSRTVPLILAALTVKRGVIPDVCASSDDANVIATALYEEYAAKTRKDKEEKHSENPKRARRTQLTPTKDGCPYSTAASPKCLSLAKEIEDSLEALTSEEDLSDSDGDGEEVIPTHVALAASAAAAPSHDAEETSLVAPATSRLKRQRPAPLDVEEEDVVPAAAPAFHSPESARSRAGTGVGVHHVAPLDEQRKQLVRELYAEFKIKKVKHHVQALLEYINREENRQRHGLPHRREPVTKDQIHHLMRRH